ncbi:hypothetical protein [Streptomyces sp. NPDC090298]|uniref:hypothetical protein n=1 Tax=Streptomyces sp. NPDC090298 TaxID=3365959 RepID=UPI00381D6F9F
MTSSSTWAGAALGAAERLSDPREKVLAWVTPGKDRVRSAPEAFATSRDTLYLLSKKDGLSSAPVAAVADAVFTAGTEAGERHGGRVPELTRAALDEAAAHTGAR